MCHLNVPALLRAHRHYWKALFRAPALLEGTTQGTGPTIQGTGTIGRHCSGHRHYWKHYSGHRHYWSGTLQGTGTTGRHYSGHRYNWEELFKAPAPLEGTIQGTGTTGRHYSRHRHYWEYRHYRVCLLRVPVVPSASTGTIESSGTIQPALCWEPPHRPTAPYNTQRFTRPLLRAPLFIAPVMPRVFGPHYRGQWHYSAGAIGSHTLLYRIRSTLNVFTRPLLRDPVLPSDFNRHYRGQWYYSTGTIWSPPLSHRIYTAREILHNLY